MQESAIRKLGYGVAALSYDSPAALAHFAQRANIRFPLLSDPQSAVIDAFGIRNQSATSGFAKGIPHPGLFILNAAGRVEAKYFEEDYRERFTAASILTGRFGERAPAAGPTATRSRIRLTPSASATVARGGQHLRLSLEAVLGPRLHAYAPGAPPEFIPVSWTLKPSPAFKAAGPQWPVPEMTQLYGVDEKVPNFSGKFEVSRQITLASQQVLATAAPNGELVIEGQFRYQACDDRVCFPPETVPLTWKILIEGHDRQRVPKELQRPGD